jgi:5-methylcytosine-specific restriction endonuclease McrA
MIKSSRPRRTLVLNKSYFPIRIEQMNQVFVNMSKETYLGIDLEYEIDEEHGVQYDKVVSMMPVKTFEEWCNLDVRGYDDYVGTVHGPIRLPSVVICATYNQIKFPKVLFPTNRNIFKRDNFTCGYTGNKLTKDQLSVDHIMPKSRGGKNTWENLITCDRGKNCEKADNTPQEMGWKLKFKPTKPENGLVFEVLRDDWTMFVDSMR